MITLSDAQKQMFDKLLSEKIEPTQHANWRHHAAKSWEDFNRAVAKLKSRDLPFRPEHAPATQEGLYRNPETGELYRLKKSGWDLIVSKYSKTGGPRRLAADLSKIEKGKWTRYTAFQSRMALKVKNEIKAGWAIDASTLAIEYAYGFCPLHFGPLSDAVSVILGYGPDCAKQNGLPWGEEYAQAKLAEMRAAQQTRD